jgi:hypothetical protein
MDNLSTSFARASSLSLIPCARRTILGMTYHRRSSSLVPGAVAILLQNRKGWTLKYSRPVCDPQPPGTWKRQRSYQDHWHLRTIQVWPSWVPGVRPLGLCVMLLQTQWQQWQSSCNHIDF